MRKKHSILFLLLIVSTLCFAQKITAPSQRPTPLNYIKSVFKDYLNKESVFLDQSGQTIDIKQFANLSFQEGWIGVKSDANTFSIVPTVEEGVIQHPEKIYEFLSKHSKVDFNSNAPIVVDYYPGVDRCSSSGFSDKRSTQAHFEKFEADLENIASTKPFYICQTFEDLEKFEGIIEWEKDPEGLFKALFFPYHAPCGGFAIMGSNGNFYVYYGEYDKRQLLSIVNEMMREGKSGE